VLFSVLLYGNVITQGILARVTLKGLEYDVHIIQTGEKYLQLEVQFFTGTSAADKSPYISKVFKCNLHNYFNYSKHLILTHGLFLVYSRVHASVTKNSHDF
jgi:hypothetical protein